MPFRHGRFQLLKRTGFGPGKEKLWKNGSPWWPSWWRPRIRWSGSTPFSTTTGQHIIGRMGLPCRQEGLSLISVAVCAPGDVISALSGKLGMLPGVSAKTAYAKTVTE